MAYTRARFGNAFASLVRTGQPIGSWQERVYEMDYKINKETAIGADITGPALPASP